VNVHGSIRSWWAFLGLIAIGLVIWGLTVHPLAAGLGVAAVLVTRRRAHPPAPFPTVVLRPDPLDDIQLEALRQRVEVMNEALDSARQDMMSLAEVADRVAPNLAGAAVSRIARLPGLAEQEREPCPLGDLLAEVLVGSPSGVWCLESDLPTVSAPRGLVTSLLAGLVEVGSTAVDQVRCRGRVEGGMAIVEIVLLAAVPPETQVGFHVAQRAAALLGGRMSGEHAGAMDRIVCVIPIRFCPSMRMAAAPDFDFPTL
jgi:hypothetical protein